MIECGPTSMRSSQKRMVHMVIDSKFSANIISIKGLLESSERFVVPKFQRNYSWGEEKVEELWNDLIVNYEKIMDNAVRNEKAQYLLGPMVLLKSDTSSEFFVIDGQQRLATLTMLFCVARDVMLEDAKNAGSENLDIKTAAEIKRAAEKINEMIQITELGEHKGWKLVLNDTDKDLFEEIQVFEKDKKESQAERINKTFKAKSLTNMKKNYRYLYDRISCAAATNFSKDPAKCDRIGKMGKDELRDKRLENFKNLIRFVMFVAEYNFVIKVILKEDAAAFQVFETLNHRGLNLAMSNLIKNHVMNKVGSNNKDLQNNLSNKWNRVFDDLIGQGQEDDVFVMESLRSRRSDPTVGISKKNIYEVIKKKISSEDPNLCKRFVKDLEEDAAFLSKLNDPSLYDDRTTKDEVEAIRLLNAQSIRFPILAAYRKWCADGRYDDRYRDLVRVLLKFFFKYRTVRRKHPGDIEAIMSEIASLVYNGASSMEDLRVTKDNKVTSVIKILDENDDHKHFIQEFKGEFSTKPTKKSAKYVLQQITLELGTKYDDVKPIEGLTLEHILPRNYKDHWEPKEFFKGMVDVDQDMGKFVTRLGNMTLLKDAINTKLRDSHFRDKKESVDKVGDFNGYRASSLAINQKTVCNEYEWTAKVIIEREKRFGEWANKIWSLQLQDNASQ